MRIWAVCKDPGGTAGMLPVVDELGRRGHSVILIADNNSKAAEILAKKKRPFRYYYANDGICGEGDPDVFITSMCSRGGGIGRELVPVMKGKKIPTVVIQDFWGGGGNDGWQQSQSHPDYITTNDEVGREVLTGAWPEFDPNRIIITGFPAFDKYAKMDFDAVRKQAQTKLGLNGNLPVISFAGGGDLTDLVHRLLCGTLERICWLDEGDYYFIPRPHPRTLSDFPAEAELWQKTLAGLHRGPRVIYDFFGQCDMTEIVAASDVVCSISSTVLLDAAVMRRGAISIMPPAVKNRFRDQMGGVIDQYPLVPLGCCLEVSSVGDLGTTLAKFVKPKERVQNPLRQNQEKHVKTDGRNAARVADLVESINRRV
ncbi:MAG: CDP-glycerol glycerophosphotransferase family protein [Patescibacteria group bacterium]